jgi:hypothetical protein
MIGFPPKILRFTVIRSNNFFSSIAILRENQIVAEAAASFKAATVLAA